MFNTGVLSSPIKTSAMKRHCIPNLGIAKFTPEQGIWKNKQKKSLKRTLARAVLFHLAKVGTGFNTSTTIILSETISYLNENHANKNWKY